MQPDDLAGLPDPTWADFAAGWADLFREPVLCAVAAGLVLGFLSGYIVLRRMVFVSAVTTQSAGLGVALAFYVQIHHGLALAPSHGAVILAVGAAALLALDPRRLGLSREAVLGLVFAASGGGAVVVGDKISQEAHEIENILFGSAVMVEPADLYRVLIAGGVLLALHLCWFRGLAFASFDPVAARVQRVPVRLLDALLFASIGIMVGVATQALGALPVFAMFDPARHRGAARHARPAAADVRGGQSPRRRQRSPRISGLVLRAAPGRRVADHGCVPVRRGRVRGPSALAPSGPGRLKTEIGFENSLSGCDPGC